MIELLDNFDGSGRARQRLLDGVETQRTSAVASRGRGDRSLVAAAEQAVAADPRACIRFDHAGEATIYAAGRRYQGGRFEVLALRELERRAREARERAGQPAARVRLWVISGTSPATDVAALQATAPPGSLFQVASQFNCLESPGAFVARVAEYFHDPTQGPRASISAFPGTLVRHYAAPARDGSRFVQVNDGAQINLLEGVCDPGVAAVQNGYLRSSQIADPAAFARALEDRFDAICVGVHDRVEVVLGHDWDGAVPSAPHRTIAQVFTSTVAAGMYGDLDASDGAAIATCRQLQRAAYLGTLAAAAALGRDRVILTLIGGGVFANPHPIIWESIVWATDQVCQLVHRDLTVIVNGRTLADEIAPSELRRAALDRGGGVISLPSDGAAIIDA